MPESLRIIDLGHMPYAAAYEEQLRHVAEVQAARGAAPHSTNPGGSSEIGRLLLVEHVPPVITISRRQGAADHLLASRETLAHMGIELHETDRGGDITYHGPGQLVAYPILDLNALGLSLHAYMRLLEQIVIDTAAAFGVATHRDVCATGVWVGGDSPSDPNRDRQGAAAPSPPSALHPSELSTMPLPHGRGSAEPCHANRLGAKLCAMGVRVKRWVSMHGLALNVTTNLDHFNLIVPCGLVGRPVTSLEKLLGAHCPSMTQVKRELVRRFEQGTHELALKALESPATATTTEGA